MHYNKVQNNFWRDYPRKGWDNNTKLIAIYLLTNHHRNTEGLFVLAKGYIMADLGLSKEEIDKALKVLIKDDFICYDSNYSVFMITNALKYNTLKNPNHQKSALNKLENLPPTHLFFDFLEKTKEYCPSFTEMLLECLNNKYLEQIIAAKIKEEGCHSDVIIDRFNDTIGDPQALSLTLTQTQSLTQKKNNRSHAKNQNEIITKEVDDKLKLDKSTELVKTKQTSKRNNKTKAYELTNYLIAKIKQNNKRASVPDINYKSSLFKSWVKEIDRLHRLGPVGSKKLEKNGYSWNEIRQLIDFSQHDQFWRTNILSAKKVEKAGDKIRKSDEKF